MAKPMQKDHQPKAFSVRVRWLALAVISVRAEGAEGSDAVASWPTSNIDVKRRLVAPRKPPRSNGCPKDDIRPLTRSKALQASIVNRMPERDCDQPTSATKSPPKRAFTFDRRSPLGQTRRIIQATDLIGDLPERLVE